MIDKLKVNSDQAVKHKFNGYPQHIRKKLKTLRQIIIQAAIEEETIAEIEETLKWGEPSYLAKKGSTIRIDWKVKNPNQYAIYFKCTSKLVPTFKELYGDTFKYEKNRAIQFSLDDKLPVPELKECIKLALKYHIIKKLPRLGR